MTIMSDVNAQTVSNDGDAQTMHTAVLDRAHLGDIHGAFGSIAEDDFAPRSTISARLKTLLAIMGLGLIVMVGDNDAGDRRQFAVRAGSANLNRSISGVSA